MEDDLESIKFYMDITFDPAITLLGIYPTRIYTQGSNFHQQQNHYTPPLQNSIGQFEKLNLLDTSLRHTVKQKKISEDISPTIYKLLRMQYVKTGKSLKDIQPTVDNASFGKENALKIGIKEYHNFLVCIFEQYFTF